jgi:hypothetical protein
VPLPQILEQLIGFVRVALLDPVLLCLLRLLLGADGDLLGLLCRGELLLILRRLLQLLAR